jgi:ClpP class serine protease
MLEFYKEDFLKKVADGRKMDEEAVDRVGRGRVWSGKRANGLRLVDGIGGFMEAIQKARALAEIKDSEKIRVFHYIRHRKLWERFIPDIRPPVMAGILPEPMLESLDMIAGLKKQRILLIMPFQIRIR